MYLHDDLTSRIYWLIVTIFKQYKNSLTPGSDHFLRMTEKRFSGKEKEQVKGVEYFIIVNTWQKIVPSESWLNLAVNTTENPWTSSNNFCRSMIDCVVVMIAVWTGFHSPPISLE